MLKNGKKSFFSHKGIKILWRLFYDLDSQQSACIAISRQKDLTPALSNQIYKMVSIPQYIARLHILTPKDINLIKQKYFLITINSQQIGIYKMT